MEIHWVHTGEVPEPLREAAEQRIRALAEGHTDLIDVRITAHTTPHHRLGAQEIKLTCEARGKELVAERSNTDLGLALNEVIDTFEREVWRMRHKRTQRRNAREVTS